MAVRDAGDTIVRDDHARLGVGDAVDQGGLEPDEPKPGWRKPMALVGWGLLVTVLLALIVWGIVQLIQAPPAEEPTPGVAPSATPTTARSSPAPSTRDQQTTPVTTPETENPTASTETTGAPMTTSAPAATSSPAPGGLPVPALPSVITLPSLLPGLPTEITLPPGL